MYQNEFATDLSPHEMTGTDEFRSLCHSAADLGISHSRDIAYRSRQTVVRRLRFHFTEWGPPGAPPILLLHGTNQSSHSWDLVSLALASSHHVFALDQRGHGDSEWSRELDYSTAAMADDAIAFARDRELARPIVVGHSMGGRVALLAALREPAFARALVLVDSGPEMNPGGGRTIRNFIRSNREFDDPDQFIDNVVDYDPYRKREHVERTVKYNLFQRADGKYVSKNDHRRVEGSRTPINLNDVGALRQPVLVVRGANSNVFTPESGERLIGALSDARLVTVPNCGHNVHSQNTTGFLEAVNPFLRQVVHAQ
ncbi:MAG: alpha/beta hydrolase [Gammaproteobacteria bacterium]|nr:alpha/beta hydrolase [Gammaproteobacteria bacterium]